MLLVFLATYTSMDDFISVMDHIQAEDIRAEMVQQRLNIHPAMAANFQVQADGGGAWTAGGVSAALHGLGIGLEPFCVEFQLSGLDAWLSPDLEQVPLADGLQGRVTASLVGIGWRPPWTWCAVHRVCRAMRIDEPEFLDQLRLPWPIESLQTVPTEFWDLIGKRFREAGWSGFPPPSM
jgi:hypothetical protein